MTPEELNSLKVQMAEDRTRLVHVEADVKHLWEEMNSRTKDRNEMVNQVRGDLSKIGDMVDEIKINTAVTNKVLESLVGLNDKVDKISQKQFKWSSIFWAFGITGSVLWALLSNFKSELIKLLAG